MAWPPTTHQDVTDAVTTLKTAAVNVKDYGAVGNGSTNDTAAFTAAIAAAAAGPGVVFIPAGDYVIDSITLTHRVTIRGAGMKRTILRARTGSTATGLVLLQQGYAQQAFLEDVELVGGGNTGQHAIHLVATGQLPDNNGGWWQSGLRRVEIDNWDGDCIHLTGGGGAGYNFLLPHQFLIFEHVFAYARTGRYALYSEGQVGQVELIGCEFDGVGINAADNTPAVLLAPTSYLFAFRGCTFQSRKVSCVVDNAGLVTFDHCYFESVGFAITAQGSLARVTVIGGSYANSAAVGDGSGRIFRSLTQASLELSGSILVIGTVEGGIFADANSQLLATNLLHNSLVLTQTGGTKAVSVPADNTFYLAPEIDTYLVSTSATQIRTMVGPPRQTGQRVYLRATGGSIVFATGGNIDLSGRTSPYTLPSGAIATFVKFDSGVTWALVSASV